VADKSSPQGTPEQITQSEVGYTGHYLKQTLKRLPRLDRHPGGEVALADSEPQSRSPIAMDLARPSDTAATAYWTLRLKNVLADFGWGPYPPRDAGNDVARRTTQRARRSAPDGAVSTAQKWRSLQPRRTR